MLQNIIQGSSSSVLILLILELLSSTTIKLEFVVFISFSIGNEIHYIVYVHFSCRNHQVSVHLLLWFINKYIQHVSMLTCVDQMVNIAKVTPA